MTSRIKTNLFSICLIFRYHGSYAALEQGFTHVALEELTGGEADAISIALASRGANKRVFWSKLKKYKRNRYLMGAGSVAADNADKELQDTGIVFGAVYTVLRVVEIEGHQLIQLRNPPGNHGEWQVCFHQQRGLLGRLDMVVLIQLCFLFFFFHWFKKY